MQVPLFWIKVLVNILQLSFSIFFSNLNMVIRSSNSCFCLYTEEPCLATTPFIRPPLASAHLPWSFHADVKISESFFFILKTSLRRPPRYYYLDFMAQCWSHQWVSTVFVNFSFPHCRTKNKNKNVRQLDYGNWCKELKFRPRLYEENLSRAEGSPAYLSFPERGNVSHISLLKTWRTV